MLGRSLRSGFCTLIQTGYVTTLFCVCAFNRTASTVP